MTWVDESSRCPYEGKESHWRLPRLNGEHAVDARTRAVSVELPPPRSIHGRTTYNATTPHHHNDPRSRVTFSTLIRTELAAHSGQGVFIAFPFYSPTYTTVVVVTTRSEPPRG